VEASAMAITRQEIGEADAFDDDGAGPSIGWRSIGFKRKGKKRPISAQDFDQGSRAQSARRTRATFLQRVGRLLRRKRAGKQDTLRKLAVERLQIG
jgi:hypothetical protein